MLFYVDFDVDVDVYIDYIYAILTHFKLLNAL
jgi:hypothetical protein